MCKLPIFFPSPGNSRPGKLPVVNFAAGGVATPADAALCMQLGVDGVFVGSGIFKSEDPAKRARHCESRALAALALVEILGDDFGIFWDDFGTRHRTRRMPPERTDCPFLMRTCGSGGTKIGLSQ